MAKLFVEAMLCKTYGCLPSQLRKEDAETIEMHSLIFAAMIKKTPHLFM